MMKKTLWLCHKRWCRFKIQDQFEFGEMIVKLSGKPSDETGMIINFKDLEYAIQSVAYKAESESFPTLGALIESVYDGLRHELKVFYHQHLVVGISLPHQKILILSNGKSKTIEIESYLRFQSQFGLARVLLEEQAFLKLKPSEYKATEWFLNEGNSPVQALAKKFPNAQETFFVDVISNTLFLSTPQNTHEISKTE